MNRFIDYATTQQTVHDAKIDALQKTNAETYERMDRRLNDCLSRDKIRDDKVEAIGRQILQLDQKQFQAALVTAPMAAPVATAPVVATPSTVSMHVPPGGLTVSPSVQA